MTINNPVGAPQDALSGMFNTAAGLFQKQEETAMELKMRSTLMEQQMNANRLENIRQENVTQSSEKEKYSREEYASPEVSQSVMDALSAEKLKVQPPVGGRFSKLELGALKDLYDHRLQLKQATNSIVKNEPAFDRTTGIEIGRDLSNAQGVVVRRIDDKNSGPRIAQHQEIMQFYDNNSKARVKYGQLTSPGGGLAGKGLNELASITGGSEALGLDTRKELNDLANTTAILQAKIQDRVPGSRGGLGLADIARDSQIRPEDTPVVAMDKAENNDYLAYRAIKTLGTAAFVPDALKMKFDWIPRDSNGQPPNVFFRGGRPFNPSTNEEIKQQQAQQPDEASSNKDDWASEFAAWNQATQPVTKKAK